MDRNAQIPQAQQAWSLRSPVGPLTTLPIIAVSLLGLAAPINILDQSDFASRFAAMVRSILFGVSELADIQRFADSSSFPQVALLTVALHWFLLPINIVLMIMLTELTRRRLGWAFWTHSRRGQSSVSGKELLIAITGLPFFLICLAIATMLPGDWSLAKGLTTQSRLGMAAVLLVGFWLAALVTCGCYTVLRAFLRFNLLDRYSSK